MYRSLYKTNNLEFHCFYYYFTLLYSIYSISWGGVMFI